MKDLTIEMAELLNKNGLPVQVYPKEWMKQEKKKLSIWELLK